MDRGRGFPDPLPRKTGSPDPLHPLVSEAIRIHGSVGSRKTDPLIPDGSNGSMDRGFVEGDPGSQGIPEAEETLKAEEDSMGIPKS